MPESLPYLPIDKQEPDFKPLHAEERTREQAPLIWQIYDQSHTGLVHVYAKIPGDIAAGTGFVINDQGRAATSLHVVHGATSIRIRTDDGNLHRARVVDADPVNDLAILQIDSGKQYIHPLPVGASSQLQRGDDLVSLGYPRGFRTITSSEGTYNHHGTKASFIYDLGGFKAVFDRTSAALAKPPDERWTDLQALCAPVVDAHIRLESGNSGGPVFNRSGEVVGLVRSHARKNHSHSDLVPTDRILSLLARKDPGYDFNYRLNSDASENPGFLVGYGLVGGALPAVGMRFTPRATFGAVALGNTALLASDFNAYRDSFSNERANKYAWATAADAATVSGAVAALAFKNPKVRIPAAILMGSGILGREATEFIPTNPELLSWHKRDK